MIATPRLRLVPCDEAMLRAIVAGSEALAAHLGARVPAGWPEFPDAYGHALEMLLADPGLYGWWTFVFLDRAEGGLVGSGGYTGRPAEDGSVEIGYEIAPEFRGRDYATEAARGLLEHALAHGEVRRVVAHTLAEPNASTRVLEKIGFVHAGTVEDPNDGTIWLWRRER